MQSKCPACSPVLRPLAHGNSPCHRRRLPACGQMDSGSLRRPLLSLSHMPGSRGFRQAVCLLLAPEVERDHGGTIPVLTAKPVLKGGCFDTAAWCLPGLGSLLFSSGLVGQCQRLQDGGGGGHVSQATESWWVPLSCGCSYSEESRLECVCGSCRWSECSV